jgi:hypothetical protein
VYVQLCARVGSTKIIVRGYLALVVPHLDGSDEGSGRALEAIPLALAPATREGERHSWDDSC